MDRPAMNTSAPPAEGGVDRRVPETTVQAVAHNLTTIQTIQGVQNVQNIVQGCVSTVQPTQTIVGSIGSSTSIVGKSIALESLNQKLSIMKPVIPPGTVISTEPSKITTTLCPVGSTVKIINPGMLGATVERQPQHQPSGQQSQPTQQIITNIPATFHVPRGPAAVANIAAPRSAVATPIGRASIVQPGPIVRPNVSTTVAATPHWQQKTSVVYAQPQRHQGPIVNRLTTRPPTTVYGSQQPRLVTQMQCRPVQTANIVTGVTGAPTRPIPPVLQAANNITRLTTPPARPSTPQGTSITQVTQVARPITQTIQTSRPLNTVAVTPNRITVTTPPIVTSSRIASTTSVTVQPTVARQLTINSAPGSTPATMSRIIIPPQQIQPQQQQTAPRVVQAVTSLTNLATVSRVIATTPNTSNITRLAQSVPTTGTRITGMALHQLPLTPTRAPTPVKVTPVMAQSTVQVKPSNVITVPQSQSTIRVAQSNSGNSSTSSAPHPPVQGQYNLHTPQPTTYYSFDPSGYSQYRQTVQPVRLVVDQGYEESHNKPNASPRPSILRKRDHDSSPAKGVAKNLTPVLVSMPAVASTSSPPGSPRGDRDGGGCHSSGSTTVSATSSPGLDEEPEQSRITINPTVEMSPRKKPRKQQLTGVELTESRCNEEEMQFLTEEKIKREIKEDGRDRLDKKLNSNAQSDKSQSNQFTARARPTPSLIGGSWKNDCGIPHHYERPSDVRPREERRPTVVEIAQQKQVGQKVNGWKVYHLTAQMEDLAEVEKQVYEKLKTTLASFESQQAGKNKQDDGLERANELIKGNMQRSNLISEGMNEARIQLCSIFHHKSNVQQILQRCTNKRAQKKRDK